MAARRLAGSPQTLEEAGRVVHLTSREHSPADPWIRDISTQNGEKPPLLFKLPRERSLVAVAPGPFPRPPAGLAPRAAGAPWAELARRQLRSGRRPLTFRAVCRGPSSCPRMTVLRIPRDVSGLPRRWPQPSPSPTPDQRCSQRLTPAGVFGPSRAARVGWTRTGPREQVAAAVCVGGSG